MLLCGLRAFAFSTNARLYYSGLRSFSVRANDSQIFPTGWHPGSSGLPDLNLQEKNAQH